MSTAASHEFVPLLLNVAIGLLLILAGWLLWEAPLPANPGLYLFYGWMLLLAVYSLFNYMFAWRRYAKLPLRSGGTAYVQVAFPVMLAVITSAMFIQMFRLVLLVHQVKSSLEFLRE